MVFDVDDAGSEVLSAQIEKINCETANEQNDGEQTHKENQCP